MTEAERADPMIGSLLDERYAIERRIARGGMATIYLAMDTKLQRKVAVKVLYPHLAEDPSFVRRFEAEAIAAAKLSHPHVVSVYDQGVDGDTAYLVMEYVPGATLRDVIKTQGRLSPRATLQLTDALLSGLAGAHQAGLVHRDVKPENVLLAPDGRIKVTDFGLARAASAHTATGALIGTVAYVSPELVTGTPADTRSDLYAVGIMLYEMLTGAQPFTAETGWQVALKHVNETVPPAGESVVGLAPDLEEVVAWCTRHDPEDRPHDAEALRQELDHIRAGMTPAQLDLGEPRTTLSTLLASTLAVLRRSDPARAAGSGANASTNAAARGTTVVGQAGDQDATAAVRPTDPEAPTEALRASGATTANTRALPVHGGRTDQDAAEARSAATPMGTDPTGTTKLGAPHTVPRLPRDTAQVSTSAETRPLSNREERALMRRRAKEAQQPTTFLQRPGAKKRVAIWLSIVIIVAALLGGAGWYFGAGPGGKVLIPDLQGRSAAQATADLSDQGLSVKEKKVFDETVGQGKVVGTDPEAGEHIRKFTPLTVMISKGPHLYAVPNVVGMTEDQATSALEKAHLKAGTITEDYDESVDVGKVLRQSEETGATFRSGTTVSLVLSKGPAPIDVPDLKNLDADAAQALLSAAGLGSVQGEDVFSDDVEAGRVAEQSPEAGSSDDKGATITWHLSKGPEKTGNPFVDIWDDLIGNR
ncbi:PASTA domain-containing protein [Galactobacter sp.]|uniref:protein kinase domain-containing protein n=1 Tax=Galactobacter sp. TaxID=2676125 RepID=UPI0025BEDB7A|nr:PASTA domain-containing protein [Galactobacter sp.]